MKIEELHKLFLQFPTICTDTRKITPDCIFFALKGDNFDGNKYAKQAIEKGAKYAIVDDEKFSIDDNTIFLVSDVLKTLQELANFHRKHSKAKVIGLTGSNGKTTTKELINSVLSTNYKTIATLGNLNNHIGVPLTLLSIKADTEIAIVEMGANHQKEIEFLCSIAEPDFGYITNFGKAHLEGFGSEEGVIKGKSELYDFLISNNKHIFFNADDTIQLDKLKFYIKKYGFSESNSKFYQIKLQTADPFVTISVEGKLITSNLIGAYNFINCGAAIIMGKYFNVSLDNIQLGIENYTPTNNRSQIIEKNDHKIILDAYNANPSSMTVALENFNNLNASSKIVFLGDMFELGSVAETEHQAIADLASSMNFNKTFLIGENFSKTNTQKNVFISFDSLASFLKNEDLPKSTILIKGSRGMALERILELL
ncbi:UDP-N-acetylmuramoyl-tripeptide--D-alanyl-D-alanine ligase [Cellulophaga baltica]|uniref:UDP-N-acetylmuramoyl-tripeptide--D-alanyl-D- alanine ligase n=1 Tax=Cellulophaga TaxID=104264 RepID=UPI001C074BC1|nr:MULTISPECIES: UDP-N-acetylmuramoyl-tripeptide--D-alanyl-D-alanine ligase [Cellulophaga]MBU2997177.1 UDP-N-acetylmuramoyl-tripeptide--D-alanyl-D-alanine ligase [Cellulophaga baltica]MDO6768575.1 UDP-N-acetylmuramoyl-tripeptide--D-alanyl-D-alanine ligase [Cellulophaga sp. 1_MG-2023]